MRVVKHLTIRSVPPELDRALREEQRRRGCSLSDTVLGLLQRALGLRPDAPYDNGLAAFAGTWSAEDLAKFERDTAVFEQIDEELWR